MSTRKNRQNRSSNSADNSAAQQPEQANVNTEEQKPEVTEEPTPESVTPEQTTPEQTTPEQQPEEQPEEQSDALAADAIEVGALLIGVGNRPHEVAGTKKGLPAVRDGKFLAVCGRRYEITVAATPMQVADLCSYCADGEMAPADAPEPKQPKARKSTGNVVVLSFEDQLAAEQAAAESRRQLLSQTFAQLNASFRELPEWPSTDAVVSILQTALAAVRGARPSKRSNSVAPEQSKSLAILGTCDGSGKDPVAGTEKVTEKGAKYAQCPGCGRVTNVTSKGVVNNHHVAKTRQAKLSDKVTEEIAA